MNSFLKTGFLLGLGAAITGKEKFEDTLTRLVEKGNVSRDEADTLFNLLLKKGEAKSEDWNEDFKEAIKTQMNELGFATREELESIQAQLVVVQEEISHLKTNQQKTGNSGMESPPDIKNEVE